MIEQNRQLLLRDKDWMAIFSDIEKHPESYERYYPMVRVKADDRGLNRLIMALVLNDALYESAEEWSGEGDRGEYTGSSIDPTVIVDP